MENQYKRGIVGKLQEKGYSVRNVHELNLILEKMGIQRHSGNSWVPTEEGVKYTIYQCAVFDADLWRPTIIDAVCDYLDRQS